MELIRNRRGRSGKGESASELQPNGGIWNRGVADPDGYAGSRATSRRNAVSVGVISNGALSSPIIMFGDEEEVADVAVFLFSEEARYMNGSVVEVHGGIWVCYLSGRPKVRCGMGGTGVKEKACWKIGRSREWPLFQEIDSGVLLEKCRLKYHS